MVSASAENRNTVKDIPVIAAEIRRIYQLNRTLSDLINKAEGEVIKRALRGSENEEAVLDDVALLIKKTCDDGLVEVNDCLSRWSEQEVVRFIERKEQPGAADYRECQEAAI